MPGIETQATPPAILVVDDDEYLSRFVRLLLRMENFEVTVAFTGAEAIERVEKASPPPQLILLDLLLPDCHGRDVYRGLRERGYKGPIIVCSAFGAGAAKRELGADGAIEKPFHPDVLVEMIRARLQPEPASEAALEFPAVPAARPTGKLWRPIRGPHNRLLVDC